MSPKTRERLLYLISPIALLIVWEVLLRAGFGDRRFVPAPSDIAVRFWQLTLNGELFAHTAATVLRAAAGFAIGVVPAIAIGLLMAMSRPVRIFFDPLIAALFPIPKVALMPLVLLAFGFGDASKIAVVALAGFRAHPSASALARFTSSSSTRQMSSLSAPNSAAAPSAITSRGRANGGSMMRLIRPGCAVISTQRSPSSSASSMECVT